MRAPKLHPGINIADALTLTDLWVDLPPPDCIVTSPPYLDMHNYGNSSRIGVPGQSIDDYMDLMAQLFRASYEISADNATFWLVAGSVRRDGALIPLPEMLATLAGRTGWTLRESITWDKQKALPWTHHGEFRDVTEQVLLLSKSRSFKFDAADLRSPIPNSIWWRRYPERYSADGRMPTNLWSIAIPTQGSWSGVRNHLCPFPEELTYRMLSLTTTPGDLVLDPLAGIGSVPAMAEAMNRIGFGLELTPEYAAHYTQTTKSAKQYLTKVQTDQTRREQFRRTIIELRLLKFAKVLGQELLREGEAVEWIHVTKSPRTPKQWHHVVTGDFALVLRDTTTAETTLSTACSIAMRPPLSKFGVDASINFVCEGDAETDGFWYESGRFWNPPSSAPPPGVRPHVLASFVPEPDQIDDTPYT